MTDNYGRTIDYLRISVTDRCNLRCIYCMPTDGIPDMMRHEDMLTYEEILRVVRAFSVLGLTKIKITGGEPLARKNLAMLIAQIKSSPGIREVSLTTNGVLLPDALPELLNAGLDGVNISLDSVDEDGFYRITRTTGVYKVMQGIEQAFKSGINVKVNAVPIKELNGDRICEIALLAKEMSISVRFIELMPIGCAKNFTPMPTDAVMELLSQRFGTLVPYEGKLGNGPARYYKLQGFSGKLGFISAVSNEFCSSCNRLRLTPNGFLKLCLHYDQGVDLRVALRSGADDEELTSLIAGAINEKPRRHQFDRIMDGEGLEKKNMFQIGG